MRERTVQQLRVAPAPQGRVLINHVAVVTATCFFVGLASPTNPLSGIA